MVSQIESILARGRLSPPIILHIYVSPILSIPVDPPMGSLHWFGPRPNKRGHVGMSAEMAWRSALEVRTTPASYAFRRTPAVAYTYQRTKPTPLLEESTDACLNSGNSQRYCGAAARPHSEIWQQEARVPFILAFQNGPDVTLVGKALHFSRKDSSMVPVLETTDVRPLDQISLLF